MFLRNFINRSILYEGDVFLRKLTNEMLEKLEGSLYEEEKSPGTVRMYLYNLRAFMIWLDGRCIDKSLVLAYKKSLSERYARASVNAALSSLNSCFSFFEWHDLKVKTLKLQRRLFSDSEKELSKAEYERLLNAAKRKNNDRLYYLMQTIASTGIRVSELRYIDTNAVTRGQAAVSCKGKMRIVFLPKQLCKMLKGYIKKLGISDGSVFRTRSGKPLDRSNIWHMLKSLCESAGVSKSKVFPHNLRHLFARTFYALQKDIVRLADILGHSSINTTRIYTIETGAVHRKQLQQLGLLRC